MKKKTINGVFNNDDSNMQLFIGSAPGDDYYQFVKTGFFYVTNDVDIAEYGVETLSYDNGTGTYESSLE